MGRLGFGIVRLLKGRVPMVVIDKAEHLHYADEPIVCADPAVPIIRGDMTVKRTLQQARVDRMEQLLTIELRTESRHCVEQSPSQSLACTRRIIDVTEKRFMQIVDLASAIRQPLARIPTGIKFPGIQNGFGAIRDRQLRIEDGSADFQMRIERFAGDEQPHDFTRTFEDCVHTAIAQKSFDSDRWLAASGQ